RCTPRQVPGVQAALPVAVVGAVGHEAQIDGRRPAAPHASHVLFDPHEASEIAFWFARAIGGKAGGDERLGQRARRADPTRLTVALCNSSLVTLPIEPQTRRNDRAGDRRAAVQHADADAEKRMTVNEVRRPVEWVAIKSRPRSLFAALFFGDDAELRRSLRESL